MEATGTPQERPVTDKQVVATRIQLRRRARTAIDGLVLFTVVIGVANMFIPIVTGDLCISEKSHNFGTVRASDDLQHEFTLSNMHPWPIRIVNVKGGCGCTVPFVGRPTPFTLYPMQSVRLNVSLNTTGKRNAIKEEVEIMTRDWTCTAPVQSSIVLFANVMVAGGHKTQPLPKRHTHIWIPEVHREGDRESGLESDISGTPGAT